MEEIATQVQVIDELDSMIANYQPGQTVAATEMLRALYVIKRLQKAYDEGCKCDQ